MRSQWAVEFRSLTPAADLDSTRCEEPGKPWKNTADAASKAVL